METQPIFHPSERADDALDTNAAARFLGCSTSKLNKARVNGGGPVFIKDGRSVRYLRRDLRVYREARRRTSTWACTAVSKQVLPHPHPASDPQEGTR
jgi:hypothetical protein